MKNFLYLRVNAIVGIIASLMLLTSSIVNIIIYEFEEPKIALALLALFAFVSPAIHNLQIIYIYRKHYPAEEISKLSRTFNTIFALLCLLIFLSITAFCMYAAPYFDLQQFDNQKTYSILAVFIIFLITISIQVPGSFRLINKVRAAARVQLESSFV